MKKILWISFLFMNFLHGQFALANSGDEVRNGGGLAENYIIFAMKSLDHSIDLCLLQNSCASKPGERDILKQIKIALPEEIKKDVIQFSSEAEKPGFFTIDGYPRLAVTGDHVGSTIYYNLDLLYRNGTVAMNYGQAIQSLIHELGHHHGIVDHNQLEVLGAEVRAANDGSINDVAFLPYLNGAGFSAVGIEGKSFKNNGLLALVFKQGMSDLTPQFKNLLTDCDPDVTGARPVLSSAIHFFNLSWSHNKENFTTGEKILDGNVILYCSHGISREYKKIYGFKLGVSARYQANYFTYSGMRFLEAPKLVYRLVGASPIPVPWHN